MEKQFTKTNITIEKFNIDHIDDVVELENLCFAIPWSRQSFEDELKNPTSIYFVALDNNRVVGYCGMWKILDEGHITNIAVSPAYRGYGIGSMLVSTLVDFGQTNSFFGLTLEVRKSNTVAQNLYKKFNFKEIGVRKNYYEDSNEDALIMWKHY